MRLLAELRRRNVIRMAGLYLVGAWLITQVAATLLPVFEAPAWVMKSLVGLLALGFVPALVFAWIYELTPEGIKRDAEVAPEQSIAPQTAKRMDRMIFIVLLLALLFFGVDKFLLAPSRELALVAKTTAAVKAEVAVTTTAMPENIDSRSIAVLPFVNMSNDADNAYFSDGISEELLNVLAKVEGLGVASRTSSFAYKGSKLGSAAIASELKVAHILEGSVRKSGNQVRITAQLIDAANDRHLWSETFDRELTDIFKIQDEIANAIVVALRVKLDASGAPQKVLVRADTDNMPAYELYLKARELFIARKELPESVHLFERSVEMDPTFARGWEGLAAVSAVAPSWGETDRDYTALAALAAERALELDPTLSMPWAVKAQILQGQWPADYGAQLAGYDKAVVADPRNATAFLWRGIAWIRLGYFERAIADFDRAIALEPGYLNAIRHKALALLFAGKEDEAFALYDSGIAKGFVSSRTENFIAPLYAHGRRSEAMLLMGVGTMAPELREALLLKLDHPEAPLADLRALVQRHAKDPEVNLATGNLSLPHVYLWLGDYDSVGGTDDRVTSTIIAWDRYPASFRNSPGMKRKLTNMGVVAYWRTHEFPPQCRTVGSDDFTCD